MPARRADASCAPFARRSDCRISPRSRISFAPARWWASLKVDSRNTNVSLPGPIASLRSLTAVQRGMQIGASEEITRLERNVPWLAITAAVTPFIGLFGTVWGIIDAFHGLGTAGGATLRAVAPGISEALITTAAGLAAAIPAVIAYNLIGSSIRVFAARGDDFSLEVLNAIESMQPQAAVEVRR